MLQTYYHTWWVWMMIFIPWGSKSVKNHLKNKSKFYITPQKTNTLNPPQKKMLWFRWCFFSNRADFKVPAVCSPIGSSLKQQNMGVGNSTGFVMNRTKPCRKKIQTCESLFRAWSMSHGFIEERFILNRDLGLLESLNICLLARIWSRTS